MCVPARRKPGLRVCRINRAADVSIHSRTSHALNVAACPEIIQLRNGPPKILSNYKGLPCVTHADAA
ncbi:hypothetical protein RA25_22005 [Leisingera sp. ANG-S5]|nr:hypothetical protein RA25_22005 [Leisingera sp. ANG-S5]